MSLLRAAFLLCAIMLQLAACSRPEDGAGKAGTTTFSAPLSNPWALSGSGAIPDIPPADPSATRAPAPASLASPVPGERLAAIDAWVRSRPDSLHEISRLLHDPDPSVRDRAREAWTTALSGGRKADPE